MTSSKKLQSLILSIAAVGSIAIVLWSEFAPDKNLDAMVKDPIMPELSSSADQGKALFDKYCISCHGPNIEGTHAGPSLLVDLYSIDSFGNNSIVNAVTAGVPEHNWSFGNMPARPEISEDQIPHIIAFIREVQKANGV